METKVLEIKAKRLGTFRRFLDNREKRIMVLFGGAGSGKSHSLAQLFIRRLYEEKNVRMLVLRKTLPALRITAYRLVQDLLAEYRLPFSLNKTEMLIRNGNSEILFKSLDDPEKIKSFEANYVWVEEATEISYEDFEQLNLRLRRANQAHLNQMFLTFNPISRFHWLNTKLVEGNRDDVAVHHSMYKDNPFLTKDYTDELENLSDENFYKIYTLGEFGELKNVIYGNYVIEDIPEDYGGDLCYGLDFGYNNPSALVDIRVRDGEYYLKEKLYQTRLTNTDLIEKLKDLVDRDAMIYADSSEPARIEEIARVGFNIEGASKSVKDGIDFIKSRKLHVDRNSVNLINELRSYKYKEDRDGNVFDEPVKFRDHILDAARYAFWPALHDLAMDGRFVDEPQERGTGTRATWEDDYYDDLNDGIGGGTDGIERRL